jgi:hypothetical protein
MLWRAASYEAATRLQSWLQESGLASAEVRPIKPSRPGHLVEAYVEPSAAEMIAENWPREDDLEFMDILPRPRTGGELIVLYKTTRISEAAALAARLHDAGINAEIMGDALMAGYGAPALGTMAPIQVLVTSDQEQAARVLLAEALPATRPAPTNLIDLTARPDLQTGKHGATFVAWPRCPDCNKPRVAMCPYCGTSGTEFPRAEGEPDQRELLAAGESVDERERDPSSVLFVICTMCDEPFVPRFAPTCEWCGHNFVTHRSADAALGATREEEERALSRDVARRVFIALLILGATFGGILAYFAWLVGDR